MARIPYPDESTADETVRAALDRHRSRRGGIDNILRVSGANPPSLDAHVALYRALMFGPSPLSRRQREMLALVVSAANRCHY